MTTEKTKLLLLKEFASETKKFSNNLSTEENLINKINEILIILPKNKTFFNDYYQFIKYPVLGGIFEQCVLTNSVPLSSAFCDLLKNDLKFNRHDITYLRTISQPKEEIFYKFVFFKKIHKHSIYSKGLEVLPLMQEISHLFPRDISDNMLQHLQQKQKKIF